MENTSKTSTNDTIYCPGCGTPVRGEDIEETQISIIHPDGECCSFDCLEKVQAKKAN